MLCAERLTTSAQDSRKPLHRRAGFLLARHQPDAKLWWPHTEALYALLRAHGVLGGGGGGEWPMEWYWRVCAIATRTRHLPIRKIDRPRVRIVLWQRTVSCALC